MTFDAHRVRADVDEPMKRGESPLWGNMVRVPRHYH